MKPMSESGGISFLFALPNQNADHFAPERIRITQVGSFYEPLVVVHISLDFHHVADQRRSGERHDDLGLLAAAAHEVGPRQLRLLASFAREEERSQPSYDLVAAPVGARAAGYLSEGFVDVHLINHTTPTARL